MTVDQLKEVMKFHLNNFNDEDIDIDDETIHNQVLSASDGYGAANSKNIYRSVMRWTLKKNGHQDKRWPNNWIDMSVAELSSKILS
ncbi:MAG: hypothetical protein JXR46_10755 [Calditrichaceae bacterium]|nr:hypothetical protein [Calditrichaceae bacterium]MBN2709512.1 hypothetical protein [Calditrichaceae bacterium]RQV93120.1 MAG: hypothetical protein EH224_13225 [Calditrichota bacterium]